MADNETCGQGDSVATGPWRGVWAVCSEPPGHVESGTPHYDREQEIRWR